ncbi:TPA: hypothetical protein DD449_04760 [Candidatus Berkelbacteria bacterium]|uniref:Uncharacterized protein n=1 Tax=Berkelbacteria bacterium GW2011_GWE1_39_12 TaxID=1618337 RepID=A0A0G4B350_9BACT|nr:MAG: hypothetical protein UT28_C0001G0572 [Berkelbacteria bacterium GW2011_GWE1_39_12]HBO60966.1 hypothetical protein [Candidatus Berkelbacteria bacterium]
MNTDMDSLGRFASLVTDICLWFGQNGNIIDRKRANEVMSKWVSDELFFSPEASDRPSRDSIMQAGHELFRMIRAGKTDMPIETVLRRAEHYRSQLYNHTFFEREHVQLATVSSEYGSTQDLHSRILPGKYLQVFKVETVDPDLFGPVPILHHQRIVVERYSHHPAVYSDLGWVLLSDYDVNVEPCWWSGFWFEPAR